MSNQFTTANNKTITGSSYCATGSSTSINFNGNTYTPLLTVTAAEFTFVSYGDEIENLKTAINEAKAKVNLDDPINFNYKGMDISEAMEEFFEIAAALQTLIDEEKPVPRPADPVKQVLFNYKKGVTTVVWKDGTVTTVKRQGCEPFDEEKGITMCFMKKFFDNRGCFNEFLRKYIDNADAIYG